jgi:hypothetical protein
LGCTPATCTACWPGRPVDVDGSSASRLQYIHDQAGPCPGPGRPLVLIEVTGLGRSCSQMRQYRAGIGGLSGAWGRLGQCPHALWPGPGSANWPRNPDPDGPGNTRRAALQPAPSQTTGARAIGIGVGLGAPCGAREWAVPEQVAQHTRARHNMHTGR